MLVPQCCCGLLLRERPERHIGLVQPERFLRDAFEPEFLVIRNLARQHLPLARAHVALRRCRQRRQPSLFPGDFHDVLQQLRAEPAPARPLGRREEADVIRVSAERGALKRVNRGMELASAGLPPERTGQLTRSCTPKMSGGVRASTSAVYGFGAGLVLPSSASARRSAPRRQIATPRTNGRRAGTRSRARRRGPQRLRRT